MALRLLTAHLINAGSWLSIPPRFPFAICSSSFLSTNAANLSAAEQWKKKKKHSLRALFFQLSVIIDLKEYLIWRPSQDKMLWYQAWAFVAFNFQSRSYVTTISLKRQGHIWVSSWVDDFFIFFSPERHRCTIFSVRIFAIIVSSSDLISSSSLKCTVFAFLRIAWHARIHIFASECYFPFYDQQHPPAFCFCSIYL